MESRKIVLKETAIVTLGELILCAVMLGIFALVGKMDRSVVLGAVFGWLLHKQLLWYAMVLSVVTALLGKRRFAVTALAGFFLGLLAGVLFGPYPPGEIYGHGHYGWAIWAVCFLGAMIAGGILQRKSPT